MGRVCTGCVERATCTEICSEIKQMVDQVEVWDDKLVFSGDIRAPGAVDRWENASVYAAKMTREKEALKVLRPLCALNPKLRLVYIGHHYFGLNAESLAKIFKLRPRRIYGLLREAKKALG